MKEDQEIKQSDNSRFVSIPGLFILLFFAVLAIYFGARIIGAFLLFFFLICLASRLWSRGVLNRVRFEAEPVIFSCHVGGELKLKLKVRNFSFFPLVWLDVILPMGSEELIRSADDDTIFRFNLPGEEQERTGIRERFVWLLWQQEIAWEEDLLTLRRGACLISEACLCAGDGFGLSAQRKRYPLNTPFELLIFPRLYEVNLNPFLRFSQEAVALSRGQQEDVTILKGSRPYRPGDLAKRINWRFLARSGRMEIKMFETVMPGCATFILDILSFHVMVKQKSENGAASDTLVPEFQSDAFETMISFIASVIDGISDRGIAPALIIPSYPDHEAEIVFPREEEDNTAHCMEALSRINFTGRENDAKTRLIRFPFEEFWELSSVCGDVYICSMNEKEASLNELFDELGSGKVRRVFLRRDGAAGDEEALFVDDLMPSAFAGKSLGSRVKEA